MFFKTKKLIIILLLFCFAMMVTGGLGCKKRGEEEMAELPEATTIPTAPPATMPSPEGEPSLPVSAPESDLTTLAQDFAEIWGTYSSGSNCQNVRELLDYMSEYFREEMEEYVEYECSQSFGGPSFSWQTKVLDSVTLDQDKGSAEILVVTEREKETSDSTKTYYSNLILELVVETNVQGEDEWRVDDAYWAE